MEKRKQIARSKSVMGIGELKSEKTIAPLQNSSHKRNKAVQKLQPSKIKTVAKALKTALQKNS